MLLFLMGMMMGFAVAGMVWAVSNMFYISHEQTAWEKSEGWNCHDSSHGGLSQCFLPDGPCFTCIHESDF